VPISAQERKRVWTAERCNPKVVGGDGRVLLFQLKVNPRAGVGGLIVDIEHTYCGDPFSSCRAQGFANPLRDGLQSAGELRDPRGMLYVMMITAKTLGWEVTVFAAGARAVWTSSVSWYKNLSRREFIQLGAAAAAAAGISCHDPSLRPWRFLTVDEARALAAISDQLIPPDRAPGGDWARVVNYIDIQLCGPFLRLRKTYRQGLISLDRSARARFGQPFRLLSTEQQLVFLRAMEANELSPAGWTEISPSRFFEMLLNHTMQGYYGDPRHGGNRDRASWRMVGLSYPPIRGRQHDEQQTS
jgi:gluconate 2-dehydrogenase gamma chain